MATRMVMSGLKIGSSGARKGLGMLANNQQAMDALGRAGAQGMIRSAQSGLGGGQQQQQQQQETHSRTSLSFYLKDIEKAQALTDSNLANSNHDTENNNNFKPPDPQSCPNDPSQRIFRSSNCNLRLRRCGFW
jgi:hypothetical protein